MQGKKAIGIDRTKIPPVWQRIGKRLIKILPFFLLTTGIFLISEAIAIHISVGSVKTLNSSSHKTSTSVVQPRISQFTFYLLAVNAALALIVAVVWEDRRESRVLALEEATIQPSVAVAKEERLDSCVKLNEIYYLPLLSKQSVRDRYSYPYSARHYSDVHQVYYYLPESLVKDFYKEDYRLSLIEYSTVHGERILSLENPELNIFFVTEEGAGFAESKYIPCCRRDSALEVIHAYDSEAIGAGWAEAIDLPYIYWNVLGPSYNFVLGEINDYPLGVLVVSITSGFSYLHEVEAEQLRALGFANAIPMPYIRFYSSDFGIPVLLVDYNRLDAPATLAGYAQAVDLKCNRSKVYIEDLDMLDTDYAAMLANHS